jgi:colanic acid biosynthesis protein WcaH
METKQIIDRLEALIGNPTGGLPEDIFLFISRITPLVNVDLLIKNRHKQTLLTWRDDGYYPAGWHIPGGIIRYKETIADRIRAVASTELGTVVKFKKNPLVVKETIQTARSVRGHFISFLYECTLAKPPDAHLRHKQGRPRPGEWAWHDKCPANLIAVHAMYRNFI